MSDEMWNRVSRRLRAELGRGPLTQSQAAEFYREAPNEPLDDKQIGRIVAETIRRARQLTEPASHWHLWIGATDRAGRRSITLHIAGIVGAAASVAQVRNTVRTPDWSIVSVSSLDVHDIDAPSAVPTSSADGSPAERLETVVSTNTEVAGRGECHDGVDWNEVYWEVTTPVTPQIPPAESHASTLSDPIDGERE